MTTEFVALTADTFIPHIGKRFEAEGGRHVLVLNEVDQRELQPWEAHMAGKAFTLIFSGPPGDLMAEGMRTIVLEDGAAFEIYIIPIHTPAPGRQDYQAVFN